MSAGASRRSEAARREAAEAIAIKALGFLAGDDERLERFLALSGLAADELRAAAAAPGFLPGVLDHVLSDDRLILAFAAELGVDPAEIGRARAALERGAPPLGSI